LDIAIEYEYLGTTADEIVDADPHLTLPQVHDALFFYYEHREELDREIRYNFCVADTHNRSFKVKRAILQPLILSDPLSSTRL
jgi:hypothetical protein